MYKQFFKGCSGQEDNFDNLMESSFSRIFRRDVSPTKKKERIRRSLSDYKAVTTLMIINDQLNEFVSREGSKQEEQEILYVDSSMSSPNTTSPDLATPTSPNEICEKPQLVIQYSSIMRSKESGAYLKKVSIEMKAMTTER